MNRVLVAPLRRRTPFSWSTISCRWAVAICALGLASGVPAELSAQTLTGTASLATAAYAQAINPVTNTLYVAAGTVTAISGTTGAVTVLTANTGAQAVAVNPVTNKIYAANTTAGTVSVADGVTGASTVVPVASSPVAIAVNPVTNKIYVAYASAALVTVIDGATNSTSTILLHYGSGGGVNRAIVVNPLTNKVYVTNPENSLVTVIDGATGVAIDLTLSFRPSVLALNPVTDAIYVAGIGATMQVINGANNGLSDISIEINGPASGIAVDAVTNTVYAVGADSCNVTVVDGVTQTASLLAVHPKVGSTTYSAAQFASTAIALDSVNNRVYVTANPVSSGPPSIVEVIDGATEASSTVALANTGDSVVVNPVTDRVYVASTTGESVSIVDGGPNATSLITVGSAPAAVAVNPVTDIVYVANTASNSVSAIDVATNTTRSIALSGMAGDTPQDIAVNPVTNKVYVAEYSLGRVAVIDGATNGVLNVVTGKKPDAIAIDLVRNKIYVANGEANSVTVIDGASNGTVNVAVGVDPVAVAVNPVTNTIYVANFLGTLSPSTVTVIHGSTLATTAVAVGIEPTAVAVNTVTNQIYVAATANIAQTEGDLTVIDGATNATTDLVFGHPFHEVSVNAATNKVYASSSTELYVVNGASIRLVDGTPTFTVTQLNTANLTVLGIDPRSGRVFGAENDAAGSLYALDADDLGLEVIANPESFVSNSSATALDVNVLTGAVYVADTGTTGAEGDAVTVLNPDASQAVPIAVTTTPVSDVSTISTTNVFQTTNPTPSFTFTAQSGYLLTSPYSSSANAADPAITALYYQVDDGTGAWVSLAPTSIAGGASSFALTLPTMAVGLHTLYVYAAYGDEGDPNSGPSDSSPEVSNVTGTLFLVDPVPTSTTLVASPSSQQQGGSVMLTASVAPSVATGSVTFTSTFNGTTSTLGTVSLSGGTATLTTSFTPSGDYSLAAVYSGDTRYAGSTGAAAETVYTDQTTTQVNTNASSLYLGQGITVSAAVEDSTTNTPAASGSVTFYQTVNSVTSTLGTSPVVNGVASFTYAPPAAGTYTYTAAFTYGDPTALGSSSDTTGVSVLVQLDTQTVFIANGNGSIASFYNNGATQSAATQGGGIGVAVDSSGYVWSINVAAPGLSRFTSTGGLFASYTGATGTATDTALAIDGLGIVWVTNSSGSVYAVANSGAAVSPTPIGSAAGINAPASISVDSAGSLWIANSGNDTVTEIIGVAAPVMTPTVSAVTAGTLATRP
jgi:YVTN family beta-propeller protein